MTDEVEHFSSLAAIQVDSFIKCLSLFPIFNQVVGLFIDILSFGEIIIYSCSLL